MELDRAVRCGVPTNLPAVEGCTEAYAFYFVFSGVTDEGTAVGDLRSGIVGAKVWTKSDCKAFK